MMVIMNALFISPHVSDDYWLINSGGFYHYAHHKEWFSSYEAHDGEDIFLGDNNFYWIVDKGTIVF